MTLQSSFRGFFHICGIGAGVFKWSERNALGLDGRCGLWATNTDYGSHVRHNYYRRTPVKDRPPIRDEIAVTSSRAATSIDPESRQVVAETVG